MKLEPETIGDAVLVYVKEKHGTQTAAAAALGVSVGYLSAVITDVRRPSDKILDAIGMERCVRYYPKGAKIFGITE